METDNTSNQLVAYSRAGDVFHYRWAARRCLRLIQPTSDLDTIIIEGSLERKKAGEYVIDVSEYYNSASPIKRIEYYQLKHTTVNALGQGEPFKLSDLKETFEGFSKRFQQHLDEKSINGVSFTIITNRKIDESFKRNIDSIAKGESAGKTFTRTLRKYTRLSGKDLTQFCNHLNLEDGQGDYHIQKEDLRIEMSRLQPGSIDPAQVSNIVSLVQEKVLPDSNGKIVGEDVLKRFGVTSERQLFPAPPEFEVIDKLTVRKQYEDLLDKISNANTPIIIHAEGGVGKSVFSQYVLGALPEGSLGIAYDCFGSGKYRSRSEPRHKHRDALVQIANELASEGLCERMLVQNTTLETDIMNGFLRRVEASLKALKRVKDSAKLVLLIDAADNAEMAAQEYGDSCFANELLRETFPEDCKVVLLCRPERTHLLKAAGLVPIFRLLPFTPKETRTNLKNWFPDVGKNEALEFHRLTNGNPRVQMNTIAANHSSVSGLLAYLGPDGTTVEDQIEQQLSAAVQKIKGAFPAEYQDGVNKICTGLASLPPNIPIEVLSQAADVKPEDIKSFVSDFGRSLWLLDSSVQFRDEPTETWFRKTYCGSETDFNNYVNSLEVLASTFTYVAEVLPQLYLQAGKYDKLIRIALSDNLLPANNPIDARNVLVYRLQFAFKAALRKDNLDDAIKLALRAGEEAAGDQRQLNLFVNNTDLLSQVQDKLKIQEVAFKGILKGAWEGSENVYTASLLSEIKDFHGEASGYLRSALNWLFVYSNEFNRNRKSFHEWKVDDVDITEIALAQLNISGARMCLRFLNRFTSKETRFRIMTRLVNRLVDAGRFGEINEILKYARRSKHYVVAIVSELHKVGHFAEPANIKTTLEWLAKPKSRIIKTRDPLHDNLTPAVVAFLEVCLNRKLDATAILDALDYYVPYLASQGVAARYDSKERTLFLKALSIRKVISNDLVIDLDEIMPKVYKSDDKRRSYADDIREYKEVTGSLLPWFLLRAQIIAGNSGNLIKRAELASKESTTASSSRYKSYDTLPSEIARVSSSILCYCVQQDSRVIRQYYDGFIRTNSSFLLQQKIELLRAGGRLCHLDLLLPEIEKATYEMIKGLKDVGPEEVSNSYISLARAVVYRSKEDAAVYFDEAINVVSKFGDEIVERWGSVVSLSRKSGSKSSEELAYRFIRCAELVGEYVDREKYWNRSDALVTCTKMSPQIGISALSRWRDREIGRFEYQLESQLWHLVKSKTIKPAEGWAMARFLSDYQLNEFLTICLENESSTSLKNDMLNDAYELLRQEGTGSKSWIELKSLSEQHQIRIEGLDEVIGFYNSKTKKQSSLRKNYYKKAKTKAEVKKWKRVFDSVQILQSEGLNTLHRRFLVEFRNEDNRHHKPVFDLYKEILGRITFTELHVYIDLLFRFNEANHYDCIQVLASIPGDWKSRVSFEKRWPSIIERLGATYAPELVQRYSFESLVSDLSLDDDLVTKLRKGIFQGLSQGQELVDASALFGFVRQASTFINASKACELTDYALSRFELHIEDEFGDGDWKEWLHVSNDTNRNIAGFIWSALGSPRSNTRWSACHVVKKLADFNCTKILDSLIEWLEDDTVGAYGSNRFPFYNLHARQYLLIALNRVSVDHPLSLTRYKEVFLKYSQFESHILIQKFSAETALNIEVASSGTYRSEDITILKGIGKSKREVRNEEYGYRVDSYLHEKGDVDLSVDFRFGFDFNQYWHQPLGDVFGVSGNQIKDLCANVVVKEWKFGQKSNYNDDPRVILWNRSQDRDTWHDHSNYPKTDNLNFYLSYHSMLSVAAKLVENMSVIITRDWYEEDVWGSWLSRHLLTRTDGKWLADYRCPLPLRRPEWLINDKEYQEDWRTDIQEADFLKGIKVRRGKETWLNISGGWTERKSHRYETYSVSTALVSKTTSDALLRALSTCSNYHDYKIPDYEENRAEIESGLFRLEGLIDSPDSSKGIDKFDPFGGSVSLPNLSLGEPFLEKLGLSSNSKDNTWHFSNGELALKCDTWSSSHSGYDEEPEQSGVRLTASLFFLKELCKAYDCDLIIDVSLRRDFEYKYRQDDYEYLNPSHKVYILSSNGRLKSTEKNYRLR